MKTWITLVLALVAGCGGPPYLPARTSGGATSGAANASVEHNEGIFEGAGGTKLFEQSWRPRGPSRGTLIVVHGLKDHSNRYQPLAERLAGVGFAVYAFDLRGHAHSEGERVYVESFDDYLDDLEIFLKRVQVREPKKPLFRFGHSMGGAIVTLFTITHHPDIRGLVLSGAALRADVSGFKIFGTKVVSAVSPGAGVFNLDLKDFSRDPAVVKEGENDPLVYQEGAPARTAKELLRGIDLIDERMAEIDVPLLVLHGAADKVTPPAGSKELAKRARSTDKTLKLYDGLYHDILHEPERQVVMGDIATWLNAHVDAPRPPPSSVP